MIKKISIRWRLTLLSALMLAICCIGLTIVLNLSVFNLVDQLDATIITTPATSSTPTNEEDALPQDVAPLIPPMETEIAKKGFSIQSIIYMLVIILIGSGLTYFLTGKALKPLDLLNGQVKNLNVNNLSEALEVPKTKDEIAELTQSFNEMTDKLDDAFSTQKRFSASAAHELRTPLAVLQTKVDVFKKRNAHSNEEYEALLSVFEKQIHRLRGLVGNLLNMTNLDDEREQSTICLNDMFEEVISDLSPVAKEKNVSVSLSCHNSTAHGNVELLYRAFYNLIENGIKYNVNGGTVIVEINSATDGHLQILVKDSGIGVPEDMKKHIFEPFYRVDKSRSREMGGAGLGLSIVDSIIKNQGGTICVSDNENGGTCFEIIL